MPNALTIDQTGDVSITVAPQTFALTVGPVAAYPLTINTSATKIVSIAQQGPMGPAGGATTTVINIAFPSTTWVLAHYLNRYPVPTFVDTAGDVIWSTYTYPDRNTIIATFSAPTSGSAFIN